MAPVALAAVEVGNLRTLEAIWALAGASVLTAVCCRAYVGTIVSTGTLVLGFGRQNSKQSMGRGPSGPRGARSSNPLDFSSGRCARPASSRTEAGSALCASCHIVASDQKGGSDTAPPFATIARKPGFDGGKIALFLMDPHPKMPDMQLSRDEAKDLGAYIASLAK